MDYKNAKKNPTYIRGNRRGEGVTYFFLNISFSSGFFHLFEIYLHNGEKDDKKVMYVDGRINI